MLWLYEWCFSDVFVLQVLIIYNFLLLIRSTNLYYSLLYLFVELVLVGIFICLYQMELFSGFLWVAEGTVVLVFLILLIYLNAEGFERRNFSYISWRGFGIFFLIFIFCSVGIMSGVECNIYFLTEYVIVWDDFYEAVNNVNMNDFSLLFLSYYNINSYEFIMFALLLFIGTMICVVIFKSFYSFKLATLAVFFNSFNLFADKVNYNFLRQQNLHKQGMMTASNRIMRKK